MFLCKQIYVSTDQVLITHFCLIKNISWKVSPLPRGSLLLVYMYLCSSKSNYSTALGTTYSTTILNVKDSYNLQFKTVLQMLN